MAFFTFLFVLHAAALYLAIVTEYTKMVAIICCSFWGFVCLAALIREYREEKEIEKQTLEELNEIKKEYQSIKNRRS